jgi:phthiocerol/phenolphthiocerol synthesis type-I polyketide synthase E
MSEMDRRLKNLSPEKRRLFELLAARRGAPPPEVPADAPLLVPERFQLAAGERGTPADIREFYDRVSAQLDASPVGAHALFLNFGYVASERPGRSPVKLPAGQLNRNSIHLVLELFGDLAPRPTDDVLDVGCGRGGVAHVLRRFFQARSYVGIDLSPRAVAFAGRAHAHPDDTFLVGDAEHLPVADASADVCTNVESSHNYGDVRAFFGEVARALRPGGAFLYTDLIPKDRVAERERWLAELGFVVEDRRDITANVLLSCDETAATHARAFSGGNDRAIMAAFLGMPSSELHAGMRSGQQAYLLYRFRRA